MGNLEDLSVLRTLIYTTSSHAHQPFLKILTFLFCLNIVDGECNFCCVIPVDDKSQFMQLFVYALLPSDFSKIMMMMIDHKDHNDPNDN